MVGSLINHIFICGYEERLCPLDCELLSEEEWTAAFEEGRVSNSQN